MSRRNLAPGWWIFPAATIGAAIWAGLIWGAIK
jgi:hypothetical protein